MLFNYQHTTQHCIAQQDDAIFTNRNILLKGVL